MKKTNHASYKTISLLWLLMILAVSSSAILTGCGKSGAAAEKKEKAKKAAEAEEDESEESEEETEEKSKDSPKKDEEEEDQEENSETEKPKKKESNKKEPDEKKSDKKENAALAQSIWDDLMKGNKRFVEGKHSSVQLSAMRKSLVDGQKPKVIVLGCSDSRVPPELLFDKNLGDLFVVRVAGNVADPVTLGSVEYAVENLHANLIVILGHESCGAVAAAVSDEEMPTKNLQSIVNRIKPAFADEDSCPLGGKAIPACIELNVKHSESDLLTKSPIIKKAIKNGLAVIKAVYKLETGEVSRLD